MIDATLQQVFGGDSWRDVTGAIGGATFAFISSEMLVVLLVAKDAADAAARYPEIQQQIKILRGPTDTALDSYLLLVIPELNETDYALVRRALDNTLVCRKILVPLDGQPVAAAVRRHFPLIGPAVEVSPDERHHAAVVGEPDDDDLELLDRNSPPNIAAQLIDRALARTRDGG